MRYRESTARTSGETNFSGVHKDSWQPAVPVLASSRAPQNMGVKKGFRAQARAPILVREPLNHAMIMSKKKMLVKIKKAGCIPNIVRRGCALAGLY